MTKTLHLTLKKKWFDMIRNGDKTEEYRAIKPYWFGRLIDFKTMPYDEIVSYYDEGYAYPADSASSLKDLLAKKQIQLRDFETITFSNGYASDRPQFEIELKGLEIRGGKKEWGAKDGTDYFVLKLGELICRHDSLSNG